MSERNLVLLELVSTLTVEDVEAGETDRNSERKGKEVPSLSFSAEALKIEINSNQIKCSFLRREEKGKYQGKNTSQSREENQQTQPTSI